MDGAADLGLQVVGRRETAAEQAAGPLLHFLHELGLVRIAVNPLLNEGDDGP